MKLFAAIDIGSYEVEMKIFQITSGKGIKEIDCVCHRMELGKDVYRDGRIGVEMTDELCRVLNDFVRIMKGYRVDDWRVCATSAVREAGNQLVFLDRVKRHTGLEVEVLSNASQRFMDYKSIASRENEFNRIIQKGTAIVDVGGGSIQISLFDKDRLVASQNMKIGNLRLRERMMNEGVSLKHYETLLTEVVKNEFLSYKKLYLKDRAIENLIIVDDYISLLIRHYYRKLGGGDITTREQIEEFMEKSRMKSTLELSRLLDMPEEDMPALYISLLMVHRIMEDTGAKTIWAPGVTLCDGIAYEYAERNNLLPVSHDFEKDIIACAKSISKRYQGSKKRSETLEQIALRIFDSMKKVHGLSKRDRLLLQIATILHDCGKYISMVELGECSYRIIMATEIIGLSHLEREIVANVVKYNHIPFDYYEQMEKTTSMDKESYLRMTKLLAMLRLANGLDRSHKQKFKNIRILPKEEQLLITVETNEDITLERGLFGHRAEFFTEVFNSRPVIRQKRTLDKL